MIYKNKIITITLALVSAYFVSPAQTSSDIKLANKRLNTLQKSFTKIYSKQSIDKDGEVFINRFVTLSTDSLQDFINDDTGFTLPQKLLTLNKQADFLDTLKLSLLDRSFDLNHILIARDNFITQLQSATANAAKDGIIRTYKSAIADIMAVSYKETAKAGTSGDMAILKRLERNPEDIIQFLGNKTNFSLRDSLIFIYGNSVPDKLISFVLESRNTELVNIVRNNSSPLIQTLLSISGEKNLKNYLPFAGQLVNHQLQLADIDKLRSEPSMYFKAIVDEEIASQADRLAGRTPLYRPAIQKYLKEYAKIFFTDIINSLHEEPSEKVRFAVLDGLRPQDLYYIITTGEDELYTSSYLYTYKKLIGTFQKNNSDSLFDLVKFDQYRKFLLMAGRYSTLASFLHQMPNERSISIIKELLSGLDEIDKSGIEELINVAETFPGIVTDKDLAALTLQEISANLKRCEGQSVKNGIKVYGLLTDMFNLTQGNETGVMSEVPQVVAPYFRISHTSLREKDGRINQLLLFFGDEDGKSSFASFLSNFSDATQWLIEKNQSWVKISSKKAYPVSIYANLPLNNDDGKDLLAQDTLAKYLKANQIEPHILVLRGHSYHQTNSFKFFSPAIRLGILGSCGGYTEIKEVLKKSPQVQVISTKQIGSKQVNEPMLKLINSLLLSEKDLVWSDIWDKLDAQFANKKQVYEYFIEYIPPYKNIALLVTALYNKAGSQ